MRYLDPVALARVGSLAVAARTIVQGALSGMHRSPYFGSSIEFAEHKEYSPGDELRHLDWKAYGKFDRYYVKRYEKDTELTAYLLCDRSGSMGYQGDGLSKLEYAAYLTAALSYLLLRQQDRVGLLAFGDPSEPLYVPPRARSSHLHDVMSVIESVMTSGARGNGSAAAALDRIGEVVRHRRSLVVLVSDLFDRSVEVPVLLRRLGSLGHDVAVLHTLDRHELDLPFDGLTHFQSMEDDRRLLAEPAQVRRAYKSRLQEFLGGIERACTEAEVQYSLVPTDQPVEITLQALLTGRSGVARRRVGRAS